MCTPCLTISDIQLKESRKDQIHPRVKKKKKGNMNNNKQQKKKLHIVDERHAQALEGAVSRRNYQCLIVFDTRPSFPPCFKTDIPFVFPYLPPWRVWIFKNGIYD